MPRPRRRSSRSPRAGSRRARDQAFGGAQHRLTGIGGLQHDRIARFLDDLANEELEALEGDLDDDLAAFELGQHGPLLARPAGLLARDPDPRRARPADATGAGPAADVR